MTTLHIGSTAPLHQRLAEARDETRQPIDREEIAGIVTAVLTSMEGDVSSTDLKLYGELESLARYIQHAVELEVRSEEHTSELQSHVNLVCRLLLEKKKKIMKTK